MPVRIVEARPREVLLVNLLDPFGVLQIVAPVPERDRDEFLETLPVPGIGLGLLGQPVVEDDCAQSQKLGLGVLLLEAGRKAVGVLEVASLQQAPSERTAADIGRSFRRKKERAAGDILRYFPLEARNI